jgi:hypothetical protein
MIIYDKDRSNNTFRTLKIYNITYNIRKGNYYIFSFVTFVKKES